MKAFIDRVFKSKQRKQKELLDEIVTEAKEQATEADVEAIIKEVKKDIKKEAEVVYPKPNHFPDCNCFKCIRWRNQNAK
jgi:ribosomal protein S3AE